jgi:hypothetical protein
MTIADLLNDQNTSVKCDQIPPEQRKEEHRCQTTKNTSDDFAPAGRQ